VDSPERGRKRASSIRRSDLQDNPRMRGIN
jgi:hypothetical protein